MDLIERVAIALAHDCGLDFNEVCGVDADPDEGYCDSGTCVASGYEDHDADYARAIFRSQAKAAIRAMLDGVEPVADALRPFAECVEQISAEESDEEWAKFRLLIADYRRAAKALYSLDALKEAL